MTQLPRTPPGWRLLAHDSIDSTSEEAKRLAAENAPGMTVVWAQEQTAGRGRHGRTWTSPKGNLYLSILLRPDCEPAMAPQLGFVVGIAMARAIRETGNVPVQLKWPNDLLADSRKVAGILLDSSGGNPDRVDWVIAGVGVNVASHPGDIPAAGNLVALGYAGSVERLLEAFLGALAEELEIWEAQGFAPVRERWSEYSLPKGTPLTVKMPDGPVDGRFDGLDETGSLLLRHDGGVERISAGDVFPAGSAAAG